MSSDQALGKGRTAIFRSPELEAKPAKVEVQNTQSDVRPAEDDVLSAQSEVQTSGPAVQSTESEVRTTKGAIDQNALLKAIDEAKSKSKVTIWNPEVSAVLRYMQLTTVRYSMSKEASILLEKAVKKAYPDVWRAMKEGEPR